MRLGYLPVAREHSFRFIAWPALAAMGLGVGLSFMLPSTHEVFRARLGSGAVLRVLGLVALHVVIRPGPALDARAWRRRPLPWLLASLLLFGALYQVTSRWNRTADPIATALVAVRDALQITW